jgi:hypothetical protein
MRLTALLVLILLPLLSAAQRMSGIVTDGNGGAISDVAISNIHSGEKLLTGADGKFSISVGAGQLVEFHKIGFRTARVRIGLGPLPPYYRIILEPGVQELPGVEVRNRFKDFKHDSLYYHQLFKKQLESPVLTGWRAFQSPFTALSKSNRELIRFHQEYQWLEEQKYVDYTFNEKLIAQLTGLKGDSVQQYMRRYRPTYEMLRSMPEYDFFSYVKQTVEIWRERQHFGPNNSRGSGGGG